MIALIAVVGLALIASLFRPFLRLVGARPNRPLPGTDKRVLAPFLIYYVGALLVFFCAWTGVALIAGAVSGVQHLDGNADYQVIHDIMHKLIEWPS